MSTLKLTKWFGFTLLCLAILLALVSLGAARENRNRHFEVDIIQKRGEQIDMLLPGRQAADANINTGKHQDEVYLAVSARTLDQGAVLSPADGTTALELSTGDRVRIHSDLKHRYKPRH
jgi:hypothetical protein